jgi:glycosyltransferase involved in cell wall biosynthesis
MKAVIFVRDSKNVRDWSGLPYFVCQAFVSKYGNEAIIIQAKNYFNIPELLFRRSVGQLYKIYYRIFGIQILYSFNGSWLYRLIVKIIIYNNKNKINGADFMLATIIPYGAERWIKVPIVAFSDGSYEFLAMWQYKRNLIGPEIPVNKKSYKAIEKLSLTICLFHQVYDDLINKGIHPSNLLYFAGGINLPFVIPLTHEEICAKFNRKMLLFIGRKHYKDGAITLFEAFNFVKLKLPEIKLVLVGLEEIEFASEKSSSDLKVISYLDKNKPEDYALYTKLIAEATLFINVAEIGGTYMTTIEAMAYGTPFILKNYPEMDSFMSANQNCGVLLNIDVDAEELSEIIIRLISDYNVWMEYSQNALEVVRKMKWENLFEEIENKLNL